MVDAVMVEVVMLDPVREENVEKARPGTKILEAVIVDATMLVVNWVEPVRVENNMVDAVMEETVMVQPVSEEKVEKARPGTKILEAVMVDATKLVVNCVEPVNVENPNDVTVTVETPRVELTVSVLVWAVRPVMDE